MLNSKQINENLRRTADKGLISLLYQPQLEQLALKYFGVKDENGNYIAYQCPYSGKTITDYNDLVLEHIIPVASNGGTVLFNCVPTSSKVNGLDEKGAKHLIEWWTNSKYWDNNAAQRLEKLVNYMLEAYNTVFEEYTIEELEESYLDVINENDYDLDYDNDLFYSESNKYKEEIEQSKNNHIYSYLSFLNDCIEQLRKENINVDEINNQLKQLQEKKVFENIEQFTKIQNITKEIITKIIGDDNRSYLTYSLNIDINKLMKSMIYTDEKEIYNEIAARLININTLLNENGLSIVDYFKNLRDIDEINILYKNINKIKDKEKKEFVESIALGHDSKIRIFIDMLNHGNMEILKQANNETFKIYTKDEKEIIKDTNTKIKDFWFDKNNRMRIYQIIDENLEKYSTAKETINKYYLGNKLSGGCGDGFEVRVKVFIDMLNHGDYNVLKAESDAKFTTYKKDKNGNDVVDRTYGDINQFWTRKENRIKIYEILENNPEKYKNALETINNYYLSNETKGPESLDRKIKIFIDMLNHGNGNILIENNEEKFTTYKKDKNGNDVVDRTYGFVKSFWNTTSSYKKIRNVVYKIINNNSSKYKIAIDTINSFYLNNDNTGKESFERRAKVFVEMLNHGESSILKRDNEKCYTIYKKDEAGNDLHDENGNYIVDKEYGKINTFFLKQNARKIIYEIIDSNPNYYKTARRIIYSYFLSNDNPGKESIEWKTRVFIDMLNHGDDRGMKLNSGAKYTTYKKDENGIEIVDDEFDYINQFWFIKENRMRVLDELKYNSQKYEKAIETMNAYLLRTKGELAKQRKLEVFIDMLNHGNYNILKDGNKEVYTIYDKDERNNKTYCNVGYFWQNNRFYILNEINNNLQINSNAVQTLLKYFKLNSFEELFELEKKKEEIKKLKNLKKQAEKIAYKTDNEDYVKKA